MAEFCIYCGKPLVNGACTCDDFQAAARQQMQQGMQQNGQSNMYTGGGYTQSAYGENVKKQFSDSKAMFVDFIKNPISMMSRVYNGADKRTAILMGVFHLLIYVLVCLAKIPVLEVNDKLGIGLKIAVGLGAFLLLPALITYGFAMYRHIQINLTSAIGVFCVATIPSSGFIIAALLISYVSLAASVLCLVMGMLAWIMLMSAAVKAILQLDNDVIFWISLLVLAIAIIIGGFVVKQIVVGIAKQFAVAAAKKAVGGALSGLAGSIFGNLF